MTEETKRLCGAKKTGGTGTCGHVAGFGTDHLGWGKCKFHGGSTAALKVAAAREEAEVTVQRLRLLTPGIALDPDQLLLQEIERTARVVAFFDQELSELVDTGMDTIALTEQGWRPRAFMDVWTQQRMHLAKICKMALDAGVAERQIKLAEDQGALVAQVIRAIFTDVEFGATPQQKAAFPAIARRHLIALGPVA